MIHGPFEDVRHRLESTVRVRRKPARIVAGIVRVHLVEQKEGVEHRQNARPERAPELDARAVGGHLCIEDRADIPRRRGGEGMLSTGSNSETQGRRGGDPACGQDELTSGGSQGTHLSSSSAACPEPRALERETEPSG